jgi:hypothetical protein
VAADLAGEIFHRREEFNLVVERHDFVVIGAKFSTIAFDLLCPRDQQAEIGRFGKLSNFARLW